ncbi:MAG: GGDEF domain-containing protein, partial [Pseudomonadota bacterium]
SSILSNVSPSDALIARLGGEEFVILCAFEGEEEAERAVANIVQTVADTPLLHGKRSHRVTISAGVCSSSASIDPSIAMSFADKAMYEAKTNGRNRYVVAA